MINPRHMVLAVYPLLFLASVLAAVQTYKLAKLLPSNAWTSKRRNMAFFAGVQVFGLVQNLVYSRQASWLGAIYFSCTLVFVIRLNWFDYLLLQTNKKLRLHASKMPAEAIASGEQSVEEWRENGKKMIREVIQESFKPEYLQERASEIVVQIDRPLIHCHRPKERTTTND